MFSSVLERGALRSLRGCAIAGACRPEVAHPSCRHTRMRVGLPTRALTATRRGRVELRWLRLLDFPRAERPRSNLVERDARTRMVHDELYR